MDRQLVKRVQEAINYIEDHLLEKVNTEDISRAIYMSKSAFYNIFSSILGTTVKSYIRCRRLSLSAKDLVYSDESILDIALQYQYSTSESYSRAFKRLYGISPMHYRLERKYSDIFPRVTLTFQSYEGGNFVINRQINTDKVLEQIGYMSNGYILDIDIDGFDAINTNHGYATGDKVLAAVPRRINKVLKSNGFDVTITRINGDEFAVVLREVTGSRTEEVCSNIIKAIEEEPFVFGDVNLSVTVSIGISNFAVGNHDRVMELANVAMMEAKNNGRNQYKVYD